MRIHDGILNCVCFLGVPKNVRGRSVFDAIGTGFMVAIGDHLHKQNASYYLVTARHVLAGAKGTQGLYARINDREGTFKYVRLLKRWHESKTADVAAVPFAIQGRRDYYGDNLDALPYWSLHEDQFLTDEKIAEWSIAASDEIAVTGLFIAHKGEGKNIPIIRGGTIAAMPDASELIETQDGLKAPGYLLETHSYGGLSGSPVLVVTQPHRDGKNIRTANEGTFLLGLIRGGWPFEFRVRARTRALQDVELDLPKRSRDQLAELNRGIAIATPIQELAALLASEDVKSERENLEMSKERHEIAELHDLDDDDLRTGPEPERLKIAAPMDMAVTKMLKKGKPPKRKRKR